MHPPFATSQAKRENPANKGLAPVDPAEVETVLRPWSVP